MINKMRLFSLASEDDDDNLDSIITNYPDGYDQENSDRLNDEVNKMIESGDPNLVLS